MNLCLNISADEITVSIVFVSMLGIEILRRVGKRHHCNRPGCLLTYFGKNGHKYSPLALAMQYEK